MIFNVSTSTIANGENADHVLGVPDFTTNGGATAQNRLSLNGISATSYDANKSTSIYT